MLEINRGGQVFFVHNSVNSLDGVVVMLKSHLPGLTIEPAHGQEQKKLLEKKAAWVVKRLISCCFFS